jgi:hypothetical protein
MTFFDYQEGRRIAAEDPAFDALIFAAIRRADSFNMAKIEAAWPGLVAEAQARYDTPGALLPGEEVRINVQRPAPEPVSIDITPEEVQRLHEQQEADWAALFAWLHLEDEP